MKTIEEVLKENPDALFLFDNDQIRLSSKDDLIEGMKYSNSKLDEKVYLAIPKPYSIKVQSYIMQCILQFMVKDFHNLMSSDRVLYDEMYSITHPNIKNNRFVHYVKGEQVNIDKLWKEITNEK